MNIKEYKPDELIAAEYNPRQLTKDQHKDLTDSIKRFGLVDPLIVNTHKDRMNILVGGHQRLKIAQELNIKTIPCVQVKLTPEKERELNIRLNRNTGEWDWDSLANYFDMGELCEWGFDEAELLKDIGLDRVEDIEVDENRLFVLTVEPPEGPKLKERMAFYCESFEDYQRVKDYFAKSKSELDVDKLLEMI